MVIIKVMGGLGNQMFQFAFGKSIEVQRGYTVKYDISYYKDTPEGDTKRSLYIERFIQSNLIATPEEVEHILQPDNYIWNRLLKKCGLYESRVINEGRDDIQSVEQIKDGTYLIGYWQTEDFFLSIKDEIKEMFDFSEFHMDSSSRNLLKQIDKSELAVSIHVRAGDYLLEQNQNVFGGICTSEYYQKAYKQVKERYPKAKFFLFTNDVEWTRSHIDLPYEKICIVSESIEEKEDWIELYLMSRCGINVIANSSYSWWSAWLNKHKDKVVICPSRWTNRKVDKTVICKDWIRVDVQ